MATNENSLRAATSQEELMRKLKQLTDKMNETAAKAERTGREATLIALLTLLFLPLTFMSVG